MKHTRILVSRLQELDIPVEQRNEYLCAALAVGLATRLPLPTGKVKNIQGFFNENHRRTVVAFINAVNEDIVFDAKEALDLVYRVYSLRYAFAYDAQGFNVSSHLMALMGADRYATPVKYKELLSDGSIAKVAHDVQRTVMTTFHNYLEEKASNPASGETV